MLPTFYRKDSENKVREKHTFSLNFCLHSARCVLTLIIKMKLKLYLKFGVFGRTSDEHYSLYANANRI